MTASILPADGMIDVLSDTIASKRDTIALPERAAKEAQADLQHLREVRAVRLARAAGFEVGQVWLIVIDYQNNTRPAVIVEIKPSVHRESDANDWKLALLLDTDRRSDLEVAGSQVTHYCAGRVDSGPILDRFAALLRAANEQKEKRTELTINQLQQRQA